MLIGQEFVNFLGNATLLVSSIPWKKTGDNLGFHKRHFVANTNRVIWALSFVIVALTIWHMFLLSLHMLLMLAQAAFLCIHIQLGSCVLYVRKCSKKAKASMAMARLACPVSPHSKLHRATIDGPTTVLYNILPGNSNWSKEGRGKT